MKKTIKRIISVLLSTLLILSGSTVGAFAISENELSQYGSDYPVITIYGDGAEIVDENGETVFKFSEMLNMFSSSEDGALGEAVINVLEPFLLEGIVSDKWDNYYDALEKEIGDIFKDVKFNKDGECDNGSHIDDDLVYEMNWPFRVTWNENSTFDYDDCTFRYDWRKDPFVLAAELNDYIEKIKEHTGRDKVCVISKCLGNVVLSTYIKVYGTSSLHGVAFASSVSNGCEIISEPISGKFKVDANAINRLLIDLEDLGMLDIDSFIISSIDLLEKSGALDALVGVTKEYIYYKVLEGVTSALALSTFFTWPSYWACVTPEDYNNALNYVFGKEGSEKRKEYIGLIQKIEKYHNEVKLNLPLIYQQLKDDNINVMVLSKYGRQIIPECESVDQVADQYVTVKRSSYGATTAPSIYETLSDEYIAEKTASGEGKYISPDKLIDASTCIFRDSTWFFKGVNHGDYPLFENKLLFTVVSADRQLTVEDFDFSRFMVFEIHKDMESDTSYTSYLYTHESMTEENCHNEAWTAKKTTDEPQNLFERLIAFITSVLKWFTELFNFMGKE